MEYQGNATAESPVIWLRGLGLTRNVRQTHDDHFNSLQYTLRDGTQVLLRPVVPDDRERIQNGMPALSSESRYFRFFTSAARLSDQQLRYFSEVDQRKHVAWVALDSSNPKHPGLGVARFIRIYEKPTMAEMAFAVIDEYQHRGLGSILLAILYLMAEAGGVQVLRAIVLPENRKVCNWLRNLGAIESYEEDEYHVDLTVHRNPAFFPQTPSGEYFKRVIEELRTALHVRNARL